LEDVSSLLDEGDVEAEQQSGDPGHVRNEIEVPDELILEARFCLYFLAK